MPQIEVIFDIDANGIIHVTAVDKGTGKSHDIRIEASSGLTQEEINAEADKLAKEKVDKLNEADGMIFQTEKQLSEFGDKLSEGNKSNIQTALESLKKAYETKDVETIQPAFDAINKAWKNASEEMYKAQAEGQTHEAQPQAEASGDTTQDVDFEEVK